MKIKQIIPLFLAAVLLSSFSVSVNKALALEEGDYSINSITLYSKNAKACSTAAGSVASLRGADNREKAFNYLTDKGLSPEQAAGVVANISHEGGYSPTRQEDPSDDNGYVQFPNGGWGIVQWTGGRRTNVVTYLNSKAPELMTKYYQDQYGNGVSASNGYVPSGMTVTDNDVLLLHELDFLYQESSVGRKISPKTVPHVENVSVGESEWEALKKQTTPEKASNLWVYNFEIPGNIDSTARSRAGEASTLLTQLSNTSGGVSTASACKDDSITGTTREKVVQVAEREYQAWESGAKTVGGSFHEYTYDIDGDWCAWFVSWVYKEAGYPVNSNPKPYYEGVTNFRAIAMEPGGKFDWQPKDSTYTPKPGDLAVYYNDRDGYYHINIVISAKSPTVITTIGGNEGYPTDFRQSSVKKSVDSTDWPSQAAGYIIPTGQEVLSV